MKCIQKVSITKTDVDLTKLQCYLHLNFKLPLNVEVAEKFLNMCIYFTCAKNRDPRRDD